MIYFVLLLLCIVPVIRYDLMRMQSGRGAWFLFLWILFVLIAGLRYRVGGDTLVYMHIFSDNPTLSELKDFDYFTAKYNPFWYVFNAPFRTINSFLLFQIVLAIIVNTCIFRFFSRYCKKGLFTAILIYYFGYYCYFNMEILREVLCICLLLEAYPYLENKKYIKYYSFCIVALLIHTSAVLMFLLPLAHLVKKDNWKLGILIFLGVVVALKVVDIVSLILSIAFGGSLAESINSYLKKEAPNAIGAFVQFLIIVPFVSMMFIRELRGFTNKNLMGALLMFLFAIQAVGMFIPAVPRFSNYILVFGLVYLVDTFYENYTDITGCVFTKTIVSCVFLLYFFNLSYFYIKNKNEELKGAHVYHRYIPYHSVFTEESDPFRERYMDNERAEQSLYGGY